MEKILKHLSNEQGKRFSLEDEINKLDEKEIEKLQAEKEKQCQNEIRKTSSYRRLAERNQAFKNIPKKFRGKTMQNLKDEYKGAEFHKAHNVFVKSVYEIDNLDKGVYLYGNAGTGKTSLLSVFGQVLYDKKGKTISYLTDEDLKNEIQRTFKDDSEKTDIEVVKAIAKNQIILLDELGQNCHEWYLKDLKVFLDEIADNERLLFVTSNYYYEQLAERYSKENTNPKLSEQVVDRLVGLTTPLEIKGGSRR